MTLSIFHANARSMGTRASSSLLRIAVVQFAPKLGEVQANMDKARALCRGTLTPRSVDLVCFPEMAFTGYMFPDAPSIAPHLEHPTTGPTSRFCAELAKELECYVVAGFPERLELPTPTPTPTPTTTPSAPPVPPSPSPAPIGANTALLHDPTGKPIHTYRKSNLFPTDLTWARPGLGFTTLDLPMPIGRIALAICNDLNVHTGEDEGWALEDGPYELAGFCRREGVRVLVVLNAWLKEEEEEEAEGEEGEEGEGVVGDCDEPDDDDGSTPDRHLIDYWAARLQPLWCADDMDSTSAGTSPGKKASKQRDTPPCLVVICNRFGQEGGKTFAGSSAMFAMRAGSGRSGLLHALGERQECVAVWTAKMGSRTTLP